MVAFVSLFLRNVPSRGPFSALVLSLLALESCAAPPAAKTADPAPSPSSASGDAPPGETSLAEASDSTFATVGAPIAAQETTPTTSGGTSSNERPEKVGHQLVYRVSPEGMLILALESEFRPSVKSKRVQGGYVFVVSVQVEPGKSIELLAGKSGPLALSARVLRPAEQFIHDERGDSKVISLVEGESPSFERTFPAYPEKPLARGQEAELRVGLWGLGTDEKDRLPVKRFFTVKASVDANGAHASIETPPGVDEEK